MEIGGEICVGAEFGGEEASDEPVEQHTDCDRTETTGVARGFVNRDKGGPCEPGLERGRNIAVSEEVTKELRAVRELSQGSAPARGLARREELRGEAHQALGRNAEGDGRGRGGR